MNSPERRFLLRLASWLARLELWLVLALAPLLMFPQPRWTPWLLLAIALLWAGRWLKQGRLTVRTPLDGPLLGLAVMTGVSLWATFDKVVSFPKLCGVALGIALFYALVNALRSERALWLTAAVLAAVGAAIAGVSLVGARWVGHKVPLLFPFFESVYEQLPQLLRGVPRAEEGFDPNQLGGTLALFIPLIAVLFLHQAQSRPTDETQSSRFWLTSTLGLAGALLLTLFVLLLTQSRMAYLATALSLLLVGATQGRWPRVLMLGILVVSLGLALYYGLEQTGEAFFGIPNLEALSAESSWAGRVEIWKRAWRVIQDHPFTGIGFDTLPPVVHARYSTFLLKANNDFTHAHNIFLQVGLSLGLPGLAAFVWLLAAFARMLWQVGRRSPSAAQRALATGLLLGLLGNFIFGLGDAVDLGSKPGVFMWAYLGLGAALWSKSVQYAPKARADLASSLARLLAVSAFLLLIAWGYGQFARLQSWRSLIEADLGEFELVSRQGSRAIAPQRPQELLHSVHLDLQALQTELTLPLALAPYLCWLPDCGGDLGAAPELLQMALDLTTVGEQLMAAIEPLSASSTGADEGSLEVAARILSDARPQLSDALVKLREIRQARQAICTTRLSPRGKEWIVRLDETLALLDDLANGALILPDLLGASGRRTWLVLIQNNDELRPTGGFISGVARLTLEGGQVLELTFHDSYDVDNLTQAYPAPPRPLQEIMGSEMWLFRDSNWSPDFRVSAHIARELYRFYDPTRIDGVMAIDQQALQSLVAALQPIHVAEQTEPITGENVIQLLRQSWGPPAGQGLSETWREHRKDFIGRLLTALVNRLGAGTEPVDRLDLGWAVIKALRERHIFLYVLADEPAAQLFSQTGWDGALLNPTGDYLMVVDANLGFNKVSPYIRESSSYTVDLRDLAQPQARLVLTHSHSGTSNSTFCRHESRFDLGYEGMMERCYWDYVRIYAPPGSRPREASLHPVPADLILTKQARSGQAELLPDEVGKSVFATFFVLSPGEQTTTRFVYDLPPGVVEREGDHLRYRLLIQKQAGSQTNPVQVRLILPAGAQIVDVYPTPGKQEENVYLHKLLLDTDLTLEYLVKIQD